MNQNNNIITEDKYIDLLIKQQEKLTNEEIIELLKNPYNNFEKIVNANLIMVKKIAANPKYKNSQISFSDRFQIGCIGLIKAIQNFDINANVKFSTYAYPFIDGTIKNELRNQHGIIRLPYEIRIIKQKANRLREEVYNNTGKKLSIEEIAIKLGITKKHLTEVLQYPNQVDLFSTPINEESDETVEDFTADKATKNIDDILCEKESYKEVKQLLINTLLTKEENQPEVTIRNIEVFKIRYGFNTQIVLSQVETGKILGISKQAVCIHEKRCIDKLIRLLKI